MMSAFWRQTIQMKQVQDGLAGVEVCPSSERASALFQSSHKGFVKAVPNMGQKSTNNIQMVSRLSSQLCTKE